MTRITYTRSVAGAAAATTLILSTALSGGALADEAPLTLAAAVPTAGAVELDRPLVTANDRDEQRLRKLHDRLGITASQESLWAEVAAVMRTNDGKMDELAEARHSRSFTMTAVEDLRSYGEITEAHAAGIRAFAPPFEALYNSMPASQRTRADNVFKHVEEKTHKKAT